MTSMTKGGNIPLTAGLVRATLLWSGGDGVPDVDASALLLRADGKVGSDDDFVFYNQPEHRSGRVKHAGKQSGPANFDVIDLDLGGLPAEVDRVTLAASADGGTFGQVPALRLVVSDLSAGTELATFPMAAGSETAVVTGEFYRRGDGWKFRAVGQGWESGLAGLARDFGIDVGGETDLEPDADAQPDIEVESAAPVLPPPSFTAAPAPAPAAVPEPTAPPEPTVAPEPTAAPEPEPAMAAPPAPDSSLDLDEPAPVLAAPTAEQWSAPPPSWSAPPPPAAPLVAPTAGPTMPPPMPPPVMPPMPPPVPASMPAAQAPMQAPIQPDRSGPVQLRRDERITLTGPSGPLRRITLDLAWQPAPGRLSVDLDASVIAFDSAAKKLEIVWYQHQNDFAGALQHGGDARGEGEQGAAERIYVDLARMPAQVDALVFTITSFHGHTFTDLSRASALVSDDNGVQLVTYDLTDTQPSTAVLMAIVRRVEGDAWQMRAIGEYHDCRTVKKLVDPAARQVGMR